MSAAPDGIRPAATPTATYESSPTRPVAASLLMQGHAGGR